MSQDPSHTSSGSLAFEEKLAAQMESMAEELESGITEGYALLAKLRGGASAARPRASGTRVDGESILDQLTGLYDRQETFKRLREEKSRADRTVRSGEPGFALLAIDIAGFRGINSAFGLEAGDMLLSRFGQFVKSAVRAYDTVGRFGGDEFLVILPGASKNQATRIAKEVLSRLSLWRDFRGELSVITGRTEAELEPFELSCSIGISDYLSEGKDSRSDADSVVARAEYALYRARRRGKRRYAVWGQTKEPGDD